MKTINSLWLAGALGAVALCADGLPTPSVNGAAGIGAGIGNGSIGSSINGAGAGSFNQGLPGNGSVDIGGANFISADQKTSPNGVSVNGSANTGASLGVTAPQHQEVRDVITTVQTRRQQYEEQQKQLLDQLQTTSGQQRAFIINRLKDNREAFQADIKQLRQELLDEAKQLKKDAHTDVDVQIDNSK